MKSGGKNKEAEPAQDQASSSEVGTNSLSNRIGASASVLLQSSFGNPSPSAVTSNLASFNANTAKGGPSNSTATEEASSSSGAALNQGEIATSGRLRDGESFRSGKDRSKCQAAFDEFAASPPVLGPGSQSTTGSIVSNGEQSMRDTETVNHNGQPLSGIEQDRWRVMAQPKVQAHSNSDGAAVVALLSDSTFAIDEAPTDTWSVESIDKAATMPNIIRAEQRPYSPVDPLAPVNPLDLIPDFNFSWEPGHIQDLTSMYTGQSLPDPLFGDVQPWFDILNRYQDEVWGDMLPLVQEAREEVKAASASPDGPLQDRPALRRLGMLLKHLNQPL